MRRPDRTYWMLWAATLVALALIGLAVHYFDGKTGCRPSVEGAVGAPRCPDGTTP